MELIKVEIEAVEQAVAQAEHAAIVRELADLELVLIGGGCVDFHF